MKRSVRREEEAANDHSREMCALLKGKLSLLRVTVDLPPNPLMLAWIYTQPVYT